VEAILQMKPSESSAVNSTSDYQRKLSNYKLYNNLLDQKDFERECNPLGLEVGQFQDAIQPYNKTYNKIQVLLGDELRRPFSYRTVLVNSEGIRSKLIHRDNLLRNYVYSSLQSAINNTSLYPKELTMYSEVLSPDAISKYMRYDYKDNREILSQNILNYLTQHLNISDLKNDAFKHALISGEEVVYIGSLHGQPHLELINPLGFFYHKSAETKWIQDSLFAGYRTYMTIGEVLDRYSKYLSKEEISNLEKNNLIHSDLTPQRTMAYGDIDASPSPLEHSNEGSYGSSSYKDILVQHVE
jgi:hypothetical protein